MDIQCKDQFLGNGFALYNGDTVEIIKSIPKNSIHYQIFSPPFLSLYTYSNSDRDMGNCKTKTEFYNHYQFITNEQYRILKPGRLLSFHVQNIQMQKVRDGAIGIIDIRGDLIRLYEEAGFIYHSEVCIWKDPVVAMQRTKAIGLLHKQLKKDACMSRQGIADYIVTMRKPGINEEPVSGELEYYAGDEVILKDITSVEIWQRYASPVWMDIRQSNTLQKESAREFKDEKHIAPLQLDVIERCLQLWTNENDIVFSPFAGIGSEIYQALKMERRGIGIELKESYYQQAVLNCKSVENKPKQLKLF